MGARRKARECALQMLFQYDLARPSVDELIDTYWEEISDLSQNEYYEEIKDFASQLARGTIEHLAEIDSWISRRTKHWRIPRMAVVDRNLLRMAVYEFLYRPDIPKTVVINEALEIARRFSTYEATQFINGVLDAIKKELESMDRSAPTSAGRS
ncbi:MAG: transcription antitermination factor NusB [Acidobacteriota bacterium]|nr:transcription antitermination factor NusB [Blastocatellia bacterium]MDW8411102.1 transcription antitermination factor NusB [Acidobacteriota bacterium]